MSRLIAVFISLCVVVAGFATTPTLAQDRIWGPGDRKRAEEKHRRQEEKEQQGQDGQVTFTTKGTITVREKLTAKCGTEITAQDDLETAIETCTAAIEENPDDAQAYYYRGYGYYYLKDYPAAERDFTMAINLGVANVEQTYYQRGVTRERMRRFRQACIEDYPKALEAAPHWGRAKRAVESCAWAYEEE